MEFSVPIGIIGIVTENESISTQLILTHITYLSLGRFLPDSSANIVISLPPGISKNVLKVFQSSLIQHISEQYDFSLHNQSENYCINLNYLTLTRGPELVETGRGTAVRVVSKGKGRQLSLGAVVFAQMDSERKIIK